MRTWIEKRGSWRMCYSNDLAKLIAIYFGALKQKVYEILMEAETSGSNEINFDVRCFERRIKRKVVARIEKKKKKNQKKGLKIKKNKERKEQDDKH